MTNADLRLALDGAWRSRTIKILPYVVEILGRLPPGAELSTAALAGALWGDRKTAADKIQYARMFKVLADLGSGPLAHCCRQGAPKMLYGKEAFPLIWHRPTHQTPATAQPGGSSTPSPRPPHPDVLPPQFQAFINKAIRLAADMTDDDELMSPVLAKAVNDLADVAEALFDAHLAAQKMVQAGEVVQ